MGGALSVVVDGLVRRLIGLRQAERPAGIGIHVKAWPVAAADVETDVMAGFKHV